MTLQAPRCVVGSHLGFFLDEHEGAPEDATEIDAKAVAVLEKLAGRVLFDSSSNPLALKGGFPAPPLDYNIVQINSRQGDSETPLRFYSILELHNEVVLRYRWQATKDLDDDPSMLGIVNPLRLEREVKVVYFDGPDNTSPVTDPSRVNIVQEGTGDLLFEYSLRPSTTHPWAVYQVSVRAGGGNLQLGRRMSAWSSQDDCTPARPGTTYKLDLLGDALMSSFAQDAVLGEHYIAIRRD